MGPRVKELSGSVGSYQVLRHWATSSIGEIYAAKDERQRTSRKVYALIGLEERDSNLRVRDSLKNLVRSSASFTHERIAKMYDVIEHEGRVFVVSDFICGETLAALLRAEDKTFSPLLAVSIASELARMLHDAHSWEDATINAGQLLHGDISPQNIIVTYEGNLVLINSGLALNVSRARPDRAHLRGHFGYFSPERANCAQYLDATADLYSLAFVLYEMLTFRRANRGSTDGELLSFAINPKLESPSSFMKISRGLEMLVMNSASPDRTVRYRTGEELVEALGQLRSSRRQAWDTRAELEKLMLRHFQHKARAMRTLMTRWTTGASAVPRNTSIPRALPRGTTAPPRVSPFSAEPALDQLRTDDIPPPTGSIPVAPSRREPRHMSFVGGIGLCLVLFSLILGSTFFWPAEWKGTALEVARRIQYASERIGHALGD
jgi:serine/threonine protein kinase